MTERRRSDYSAVERLTPAESRCLQAMADGKSGPNGERGPMGAAASLGVAVCTLHTHLQHARQKLFANHTTHAVAIALRRGLIK